MSVPVEDSLSLNTTNNETTQYSKTETTYTNTSFIQKRNEEEEID